MMHRAIRIVHLVPNLTLVGAQRVTTHILGALDNCCFEPSAIIFRGPSGTLLEAMLAEYRITITCLGKRPSLSL